MTVAGQVVDSKTKNGIPGASVVVVDGNGTPTTVGTVCDANGNFVLQSTLLDNALYALDFSSVGYIDAIVDPSAVAANNNQVPLDPVSAALPAVTITPTSGSVSPVFLLGLGVLGVLAFSGGSKNKVGAVDSKTLLTVAAVGVGGFLFYNMITKGTLLPSTSTPAIITIPSAPTQTPISQVSTAAVTALPGILNAANNLF
jgi:CarboxypepD_reg-like domain